MGFDTAAFRQPLAEGVPIIAVHDPVACARQRDQHDRLAKRCPQGDAIGQRCVRSEGLAAAQAESIAVSREQSERIARVGGAASEPFLFDRLPYEP
jgi:hypothetical protein